MGAQPDVALLISTYQRPQHLERVLASVACQQGLDNPIEIVITDDGSTDETGDVVDRFARSCRFPVKMTTHHHAGFQLARCRNDGVRASTAPYLLFLDGDCLIPPDHVAQHLRKSRPGVTWGGYCYRLDNETSQRIDVDAVRRGDFLDMAPAEEVRKLRRLSRRSRLYSWIRHPTKPRLFGGNIGIHRADYERINGYDENFIGWGGEDDDLRLRLRRAGVAIRTILPWTRTYHLWHPPVASAPVSVRDGRNIPYLTRAKRLTRCRNGLVRRTERDLRVRVCGEIESTAAIREQLRRIHFVEDQVAEVELALAPYAYAFTGQAEWNVLVDTGWGEPTRQALNQADLVVSNRSLPWGAAQGRPYRLDQLTEALRFVA